MCCNKYWIQNIELKLLCHRINGYRYSIVMDNFIFILLSRPLFTALNNVGMQNGILGLKLEKDKVDIIYLSDVQCCWSWKWQKPWVQTLLLNPTFHLRFLDKKISNVNHSFEARH